MLKFIISLVVFVTVFCAKGNDLFFKTFGEKQNDPVIFLHGGPGYNSANFEATSAQKLSENGFFVIVYDRRGEGRSIDKNAKYHFEEAISDLERIYLKHQIKKAILLGHSFGGILATKFTEQHPDKVKSIVLIGAPVSMQAVFKTIIESSKKIYQDKNDATNLQYIGMLEKMDTKSLQYSSYCFMHAMQNGFYSSNNISNEAKKNYSKLKESELYKYAIKMDYQAPQAFWKNERYTSIDLTSSLNKLLKSGTKVYGFYGKDDGLFSVEQVNNIRDIIGAENLFYLEDCSHNVFIDRQKSFIKELKKINEEI